MSIARNSVLSFVPQAVLVVTSLLTSIVTARLLGPEGRGLLSVALLVTVMLAWIADMGLGSALTFFSGKKRIPESGAMMYVIYATLGPAAVVLGAALLAWPWLSGGVLGGVPFPTFVAALCALPAMLFVNLWIRLEMVYGRYRSTMLYQSAQAVAALAGTWFVLLAMDGGPHEVVVVTAVVYTASALLMAADSARVHGFSKRVAGPRLREVLSYSVRSYLGGLVYYTALRVDSFILNASAGNAAVGQYSMAVTLAEKLWLVDSSISQATMPQVVGRDRDSSAAIVAASSRMVVLILGVLAVTLWVAAPFLIGLLYGSDYLPAVLPLRILLPGVVLFGSSRILSQYYMGQLGRPGVSSAVSVGMAVVGVALYMTLIPAYGFVGAAIASSATYSLGFVANAVLFCRATGTPYHRIIVPTSEEVSRIRAAVEAGLHVLSRRTR
ncbi:MAG: oligosaccharide flippase family protein [Coriobacteriia bacterium]|nr:oligosaccharide flippase family protein [Coriobacteriia bacterium]MBN2847345.1 oligosaccharide flippase family protein [Coriobacteriia bacterium]